MREFNRGGASANADAVAFDQAEVLISKQLVMMVSTMVAAGCVVAILEPLRPKNELIAWVSVLSLVSIARYLYAMHFVRTVIRPHSAQLFLSTLAVGSLISGIVWSVVPAIFLDYRSDSFILTGLILCAVVAGSAIQGTSYSMIFLAFSAPIFVPFCVGSWAAHGRIGKIMPVATVAYVLMLTRSSFSAQKFFIKNSLLKQESRLLAEKFGEQNASLELASQRFYRLANHDSLTGVANRACFTNTIAKWIEDTAQTGTSFCLFLLDVDHFKAINDALGHGAGDDVLTEVAHQLSTADGSSSERFVARLGGDEFAVLLRQDDEDGPPAVADQIVTKLSGAFGVRGGRVNIGVSIGVAQCPRDAGNAEDLLARADLALYAAKDAGRQCWRGFEPAMLQAAGVAHDIEQDLDSALVDGSIEVWFQPQVAIESGRVVGFEALLRWNHVQHGWTAPPVVVAAALKSRRSAALTSLVLERACSLIAVLAEAGLDDVGVAINVCPGELEHYDLAELVASRIAQAGVAAHQLEIEITEETVLVDARAIDTLAAVRRSGVRLAIDDFGAGNSSLAYLRSLRVDRIKIDRCFVSGLAERDGDRMLVQAILGLGRSLGLDVVAEGVESADDVVVLRALGCHVAQGYHFGRAAPVDDIRQWIAANAPVRAGALSGGTHACR